MGNGFFKIMKMIKKIKLYELLEVFSLVLISMYIVFMAEKTTEFGFTYTVDVNKKIYSMLWIVVVVKLLLFLWSKKRKLLVDKTVLWTVIIFIFFVVTMWGIYHMVYLSDKYEFLRFMGILTVGVVGTDYRKVLKAHVIVVGLMIGSSVLASLSGYIVNYVIIRKGHISSSWGTLCTTDYASNILFLCIIAWIAWKKLSFRFFLIVGALSVLNSWFIARSITSTVTGICFIIAIILDGISITKRKKLVAVILSAAFPFFSVLTFGIEYLYHRGTAIGIKINQWTHGRFLFIDNGFKNYGIKLFGRPFNQIGNGGNTFAKTGYNFIDSSYVLILLRYGLVLFIAIMLLWILMTRKAVKMGHWRLAFGLALIALHSFSEHHFPEVNYNILVILPFSVLGMGWLVKDKDEKPLPFESGRIVAGSVTAVLMVLLAVFAGPYLLSMFRTIFDVTTKVEIKDKNKIVSALFAGFILLFAVFTTALYKLLHALFDMLFDKTIKVKKKIIIPASAVVLVVIIMFSGIFIGKKVIDAKADPYLECIDEEKTAIEAVQRGIQTSGGKLYANDLPYIYRKTFGGFTESYFQSDEMASRTNVTVLMEGDYESQTMFAMGFLYTVISDDHSLYTNDASVIKELEAAGYHMTGYFSRERIVDLKEEAERNELPMTEDGAVIVGVDGKPLRYGPYYELRSGYYTVTYDLSLPKVNEYWEDYKVCTLAICVKWGTKVAEVPVFRRDFDEEGKLHSETRVSISEARGCEFKIYPEGGNTVLLSGVTCRKTPDIDARNIFDKKGRVIRTEYYDLEGNPIDTTGGYHRVEYKYNSDDLVSFYRYYDIEGNPVIISSGYAGVNKKYDIRKRAIRETYYDTDGSRLTFDSGYSTVGYGYDDNNNINEYRYYDAEDAPVMLSSGYSILRRTYDEKKRVIYEEYYDTEDNPVIIKGGYAKIAYDYDDTNREIRRCLYGTDGKLIVADSGYAQRYRVLDKDGKELRVDYYDADGNRTTVAGGYSVVENKYDMYGNQSDMYFYNEAEEPVLYYDAYFHLHRVYNASSQIVRETRYDTSNHIIIMPEGYATVEMEYDGAGNAITYRYLDESNKPMMRTDGYAELDYTYNEKYHIITEMYRNESGKRVTLANGTAAVEYGYDDNGNQTDVSYFDVNGKPALYCGAYFKLHRYYNELKQNIREDYLDADGKIMMRPDGFAATEREYDAAGNMTEQRYLDLSDNLSLNTSGYAILRREYDSANHITKEYYLGLNSEPVDCTSGYATVENTYDDAGNLVKTVYYNAKGEVVE